MSVQTNAQSGQHLGLGAALLAQRRHLDGTKPSTRASRRAPSPPGVLEKTGCGRTRWRTRFPGSTGGWSVSCLEGIPKAPTAEGPADRTPQSRLPDPQPNGRQTVTSSSGMT